MGKGAQTRKEIVEHALGQARRVGLEALSLGALAAETGMSKSGLFAHFKSKQALQLEVLEEAVALFVRDVVQPAVRQPRGEPRLRALFQRYLTWIRGRHSKGGCIFMALGHEYDDRPGAVRDALVRSQRDWYETITRVARTAIDQGHFRADVDAEQVAYEFKGIGMAFDHAGKLLGDAHAKERAHAAFEALIARCRPKQADDTLER